MTSTFVWIGIVALVALPTVWAVFKPQNQTALNYQSLRTLVGLIAVSIACVATWASAADVVSINSISASYHTGGQDLFVGTLMIVAAFLFAYEGDVEDRHGPDATLFPKTRGWIEFGTAKLAAISIATVALFPTSDCPAGTTCSVPAYIDLPLHVSQDYHLAGAIAFFLCLAAFLMVFIWRVVPKVNNPEILGSWLFITPLVRLLVYGAGLLAIAIGGLIMALDLAGARSVFWAEFLGLTGFGVAWFIAGIKTDRLADADQARQRTGDEPALAAA